MIYAGGTSTVQHGWVEHGTYIEAPAVATILQLYIANYWLYVYVYTLNVRNSHGYV